VRNDAGRNADGSRDIGQVGAQSFSSGSACRCGVRADGRQGEGRKSGRNVSAGLVHIQTNRPEPFVPSSACREAHESPNDPDQHCGGNHRRGPYIHQCACRYDGAAGRHWPADHCGASVPAGLIDPARPSTGGADAVECAECLRAGSDEPDREAVQFRQAPPEWTAETVGGRRRRLVPRAGYVNADGQTSRGCAGHGATDLTNKRQDNLRRDKSGSGASRHDTDGLSLERGRP